MVTEACLNFSPGVWVAKLYNLQHGCWRTALVCISLSVSGPINYYFFAVVSFRTGFKKQHPMKWDGFPFVISSTAWVSAIDLSHGNCSLVVCFTESHRGQWVIGRVLWTCWCSLCVNLVLAYFSWFFLIFYLCVVSNPSVWVVYHSKSCKSLHMAKNHLLLKKSVST